MMLATAALWLAMTGHVSIYSNRFRGKRTASGERYDPKKHTAASRHLPISSCVLMRNSRIRWAFDYVRINDRGPFVRGRVFDLSRAAAKALKIQGIGTVNYRLVPREECREER